MNGSYAYVTAFYSDALVVVDVSNPASPVIRGSVASSSLMNYVRAVWSFARADAASPVIRGSVVSSSLLDGVRVTLSCDPELRMHPCAALASAPSIVLAPKAPPLLMSLRTLTRSLSCAVHEGLWRRRERLVRLRGGD